MTLFPLIWLGLALVAAIALIMLRPNRHVVWLVVIALLLSFATWVALPNNPGIRYDFNGDEVYEIDLPIRILQGLDLAGGVRVLLEADVDEGTRISPVTMEDARRTIDSRINALGALEPVVQLRGDRRIIVELPGYEDPEGALQLIRATGLLEFIEFGANPVPAAGTRVQTDHATEFDTAEDEAFDETQPVYHTAMTGEILQSADVGFDPLTGKPVVNFILTTEGSEEFGEYTRAHTGQPLGIVVDGVLLSAPTINDMITQQGTISGDFSVDDATQLATQLRYGALPVPLEVESTTTVGPTLGRVSVDQSIRAGIIGISVVLLFMLVYYRILGISSALALLSFAVLNLALYKIIPITMTLPAITGFLISVGTAVDGNILIFERIKEELRSGKRLDAAVDAGFNRAWTSIRDSNLSTIIICIVLYTFGTSFGAGAVRGFALTLAIGLVINLFTAVTVTRTFLHFILLPITDQFIATRGWLMGLTKGA